LILYFNSEIYFRESEKPRIYLAKSGMLNSSAQVLSGGISMLVSFPEAFYNGISDTVYVSNIFSKNGIRLDARFNNLSFAWNENLSEPYVKQWNLIDRYHLSILFSEEMDKPSLLDIDNYSLEPSGLVIKIKPQDDLNKIIKLTFSKGTMSGSFGKAAYLVLNNIKGKNGVLLEKTKRISLNRALNNLENLVIYPQPVKPQNSELIFANLPEDVEINIFNINGILIKSIEEYTNFGGINFSPQWYFHSFVLTPLLEPEKNECLYVKYHFLYY